MICERCGCETFRVVKTKKYPSKTVRTTICTSCSTMHESVESNENVILNGKRYPIDIYRISFEEIVKKEREMKQHLKEIEYNLQKNLPESHNYGRGIRTKYSKEQE